MEPREKYEQQPFISSYNRGGGGGGGSGNGVGACNGVDSVMLPAIRTHHHQQQHRSRSLVRDPPQHRRLQRRRRSKCRSLCCTLLFILSLLLIPIVLLFYIWIWQNECFLLLDDNAPIQLGVNVQKSRLFIIFTKPLPTGTSNSSLNVCGSPTSLDTTFLPAFGGLSLTSANFTLKTQRCHNLPLDLDTSRGTLKLIIDGDNNETAVTVQNVHVAFNALDLPRHGYFQLLSSEDGVKAKLPANDIAIDFIGDGVLEFRPAIGLIYSKFTAVVASEVTVLAGNSSKNHCGAPAIGITLDGNIFAKAWQAFRYWINYSFPELSPIGFAQLFQLLTLQISQVKLETKPVIFETSKPIEPKHAPVFINEGRLQVDRSSVTLSNFSLQISDTKVFEKLRTFARIEMNLPAGNVDAIAALKNKRLQLATSFRESMFNLPFDIDISNNNNRRITPEDGHDVSKLMANPNRDLPAGLFQMKNITVRTAENSTIFTPSLSGVVEPIYVRSSRQLLTTQQCSSTLLKFISLDFVTSAMTVPAGESLKVVVVGSSHDTTPLTINLYQLGRVANNLKMIVSTNCLEDKPTTPQTILIIRENKSQEKRHSLEDEIKVEPRSEALLQPGTYRYNFTFGHDSAESSSSEKTPAISNEEDDAMKLQYWSFDADDVDARVYPIENFLQIDKIAVKLNTTNEKANLDLQVGLKPTSSSSLFKALL